MAITLDKDRIEYANYFKWFKGDLDSLFNITPPTLINGLSLLDINDLSSTLNYFSASSKFYINALLSDVPEDINPYFKMLERMVTHWSVTGEYCLVVENGVINTIRPDYVFPIRKPDNEDVITGYYFIFPMPDTNAKARVIQYDIATGIAFQSERTFAGNHLEDVNTGIPVGIQGVLYEDTGSGFYKDIAGLVRELFVRYALLQLSLNSSAIPLLQIALDGIGGGLLGADGITPARIAGLGKTGLGMAIPPPFTGEEGARYIERSGVGLAEAMGYIRIILGSLAMMSGVPEYVYGVSLSQSTAEVQRVMFMGESRVNRMKRALTDTFGQLGIEISFEQTETTENETIEVIENANN